VNNPSWPARGAQRVLRDILHSMEHIGTRLREIELRLQADRCHQASSASTIRLRSLIADKAFGILSPLFATPAHEHAEFHPAVCKPIFLFGSRNTRSTTPKPDPSAT